MTDGRKKTWAPHVRIAKIGLRKENPQMRGAGKRGKIVSERKKNKFVRGGEREEERETARSTKRRADKNE